MDHDRDAPGVTAMRGESAAKVTRNHALFGLLMLVGLAALLMMAGAPG